MQYVTPVDLSNVLVNMPVRAQTMLVNGFPVQSVAEFNYSANRIEISQMYMYDASENGLDPYYIDMSGTSATSSAHRIDQAYYDRTKDMKVHPIMQSNKYALNLYPIR